MLHEKNYLMFDFGASHGRCIVAKYNGNGFQMDIIHDFENNPVKYADTLYWDLLCLVHEMQVGFHKALKKYPNIESVGVDTWGCDFAFLDKYGKLLANPVNYRDELRYKYKKELDSSFGEYELFSLAGANTNNIMGLYHLYGLLKERPEEFEKANSLLMMPDLFNYFLTGEIVNEYTDATMTLMVDQKQKTWQKKITRPLGLPDRIFTDIVMPGNVLGPIQKTVYEQYDLPRIPVINVASHDTASAIAGIPIQSGNQNWAFISLGTWAIIGMESDEIHNSRLVFESGFGTQGGCEGKNNFVNLISGLWVIQQCYESWKKEEDTMSWDVVVKAAAEAKSVNAVIPLDDEQFAMPNPKMPDEVAKFCATTGQQVPLGMGEVARCIYESLVLKLKDCYEDMVRLTGKKVDVLHVVGGGSKNKLLCQWLADSIGVFVKAGPSETTTVGNLLIQMKGTGEISNLSEGREIAASSFDIKEYTPKEKGKWDERYGDYLNFKRNHNGKELVYEFHLSEDSFGNG